MQNRIILRSILLSLCVFVASSGGYASASGNPDFVGILASITEPSNAAELGLTQDQLDRLETLIKQHESQALTFASEIRQLPSAERRTKATENIRKIERQGFALLNEAQQAKAELWRRQKLGPAALIEPEVAKLLGISEVQTAKMNNVLEGRSTLLREMGRTKGEAELNSRLFAVLDDSQKTIWQTMVGKPPQIETTAEASIPEKTSSPSASDIAVRERSAMTGPEDGLVINFNATPWKEVLKWLSKEAELSLQGDSNPQGSFTYQDKYRRYSVAETMDVMNGVLLGNGYTLVKNKRVLISVDLEKGGNPELIKKYVADLAELVTIDELKNRGTFEILKCVFKPDRASVEEMEKEVKLLIGPTGSVVSFPTIGQVLVCETGGKLRIIRDLISGGSSAKKIEKIVLKHVSADEVLGIARPLLGLKDGINTSDDLSISTDTFGTFILATGSSDKLQKLKDISTEIDIKPSDDGSKTIAAEPVYLKSHRLLGSDGDTTWDILQSTFAGQTNIKLSRDPKTGNIIAEATKADHEKIDRIIGELAGQSSDFEVIQLTRLDTQAAILTLEKFYGKQKAATDSTTVKGPIFYGDPGNKRIMVKGTKDEVEQIRKLLNTVEASSPEVESLLDGILLLPYRGKAAERMLDSIDMLRDAKKSRFRLILPESKTKVNTQKADEVAPKIQLQKDGRSALEFGAPTPFSKFVTAQEETRPSEVKPVAAPLEPQSKNDVVIRQGPNGLIVTSDNKDALKEFNQIYKIAEEEAKNRPAEPAVIVLKYIRSAAAAELIKSIIAGEAATASSGGGGGLIGEVASSVLGGGLFGGLFGGGASGGSSATASVSGAATTGNVVITPDPRLNAIWVQANGSDMQMVEDLVTMIDIPDSGVENLTRGTPETIFIDYIAVEEVEAIVKQVFADRIAQPAGGAGGAQRQPSPQEIFALIGGGGRGGRGGGGGAAQSELKEQTMTVSSDKKNNALIVVAPPMLFQDVKKLVTQMDTASKDDEKDVVVMPMPAEVNPTTMQNALKSAFGASVKTTNAASTNTPGATGGTAGNPADFLQQFRNRGGAGGAPAGFGGGGFGAGGFGAGGFGGQGGGFGGQGGGNRGGFGGNQGGGGFGGNQGGGNRGGQGGTRGGTQGGGTRGGR